MTITEPIAQTAGSDEAAIAELHELFDLQRAAFLRDTYPTAADRRARLEALMGMVMGNRARIHDALSEDFEVHPGALSDLAEVLTVVGRAAYAHQHLEEWMAPEPRETDPNLHGTARAAIVYQPKGVIGNMSPWNFPFDLSLGPLVDMLAAGNRVILKPSEYTPACSELLKEMVSATFDRDLVGVVTGGLELAKEFPTLRWDHLLYTGNTEVGRLVAKAAAENLVPVTLELGGKSPVVVLDDSRRRERRRADPGDEDGQERADVHLARLRVRAARADPRVRGAGEGPLRRPARRIRGQRRLHRDHLRAPPRSGRPVARRSARERLRDRPAGRRRDRPRTARGCRSRS